MSDNTRAPVESKVWASTIGVTGALVVTNLINWLLGVWIWNVPGDATHVVDAVAAVPVPVLAFTEFLIPGATAFLAGYLTKHTPRLDETIDALDEIAARDQARREI